METSSIPSKMTKAKTLHLDDQNCFSQTEDKLPDDLDDDEHKDLFDMLGIGEGEASPPRGEAVSDSTEEPSGSRSIPKTKPIMPSGKPCPPGFNWDGVRLVRNKKGSKRPPDTPSEFWHMYAAKQREEDIARYKRKVELEEERIRKEREEAAPAMPVMHGNVPEPHREKMFRLYWEKLGEVTDLQLALVARVVSQAEVERTPAAKAAMDKEWQKLVDKSCWLEKKVREFQAVTAEAKRLNQKAHFGRIFEICSQKGSELPPGHPDQKWKGRSVFQGNRVQDERNDHAIFAELGSSPASVEAAKVIDVFGSQPGYAKQQADARQAYTQALFEGIETWVRLPRNRWPKEWEKYKDPVRPPRFRRDLGKALHEAARVSRLEASSPRYLAIYLLPC